MITSRPVHPDFLSLMGYKDQELVELFLDLRAYVLHLFPASNELLYHTRILSAAYSVSEKLTDAFCHIPVYNQHLNLGFNLGAKLPDPEHLLQGTGKLIRHIKIKQPGDYNNPKVRALLEAAYELALNQLDNPPESTGKTILKLKKS
ncbi:MAG: DUF5655 domain-containing protein [Candidatus Cyclobacteriaceae bacterium M3_2C_046]